MNTDDLNLLLEVARLGSFAAVGRQRNVDASSISRTVAAVEEELGVRLFERSTRRMEVTEAGDQYLARVRPLIEELERAGEEARAVRAAPRGTLRLSASVTFGQKVLVPLLAEFQRQYPLVKVEGLFTDSPLDLVAEKVDLAIRLASAIEGDFVVTKLMDTRYRVVASPGYLRRAPPLRKPADLVKHRSIVFSMKRFRSRWYFRNGSGKLMEQPLQESLVLSPTGAILDAAVEGLGVALLPEFLLGDYLKKGQLKVCLPKWDVSARSFDMAAWLIYPSRSYLPGKTRAMIDFLKAQLQGKGANEVARGRKKFDG